MKNSEAKARKWAEFLGARPEFDARRRFLEAFNAGRITRLCDCGRNSFDLEVPEETSVEPLAYPGSYGMVYESEFRTDEENGSIGLFVFVDQRGQLAGVDVEYCGNSCPAPENPSLVEPPYHVRTSERLIPDPAPSGPPSAAVEIQRRTP